MSEAAANRDMLTSAEWELTEGSSLWAAKSDLTQVAELVDNLPSPMRDAVELRIWGRMSFQEIADILHLGSRGAAHVYYTRGLDKLKAEIEGMNNETN